MAPRLLAPWLAVAAAALVSGCIQGAFFPATIPGDALASGWSHDSGRSSGGEQGMRPVVVAKYQVNAYFDEGNPGGTAYLITVSDVPVLDEQAEVEKQLHPRLSENGVTLRQTGTATGSIGADRTTYRLLEGTVTQQGVTVKAKAVDAPYTCGANGQAVRVFGLAAVERFIQFGGQVRKDPDESTWQELVGSNPSAGLGGMVARVRCA